jgi:protein SCO1
MTGHLKTAVAALIIALVGGAALWQDTDGLRAFTTEGARRLSIIEQPRPVPDARLVDMRGQELTLADEIGRALVVEFIYTTCPTLCIALGESFAKLQDAIKAAGLADQVRLVSISFDLARDGPDALKEYAEAHGADGRLWIAVRPENEQALQSLLKVFGVTVIPDGAGGFVHNAALHVIDRQGRLKAIFDIGEEAQALAAVRRQQ